MPVPRCAGLIILALIQLVLRLPLAGATRAAAVAVAIVVGAITGGMLGRLLTGVGSSLDGSHETQSLLIGLVFGGIAAGFFWLRERNALLATDLQVREMARLGAEKQSLAAHAHLFRQM